MYIKLIFKNLKLLITKTPMTFIILLIIQIASACIVVLTYGIVRNVFSDQEKSDYISHKLSVECKSDQNYPDEDINSIGFWKDGAEFKNKLDELLYKRLKGIVSDGWIKGVIELSGKPYTITIRFTFDEDVFDGRTLIEGVGGKEKYSYLQYLRGETLVKVKYDDYPVNEGDKIKLGNKEYTVVYTDKDVPKSASGLSSSFYVPYTALPEGVKYHSFNVIFKEIPSAMQIEKIKADIIDLFGYDYKLSLPNIPDLLIRQFNSASLTICCVVVIILLLNCVMLYLYILRKRQRWIIIIKLCGCTGHKCALLFIIETMTISFVSFGIGITLSKMVFVPVLEKYYPAFQMVYNNSVYVIILIIMSATIFVFLLAGISMPVRKTIVKMKGAI